MIVYTKAILFSMCNIYTMFVEYLHALYTRKTLLQNFRTFSNFVFTCQQITQCKALIVA